MRRRLRTKEWDIYDQYAWAQGTDRGERTFDTREDAERARDEAVRSTALAWHERQLGRDCLTGWSLVDDILKRAGTMAPGPEVHPGHPDRRRFPREVAQWLAAQFVQVVEAYAGHTTDDFIDRCSLEMTLRNADVPRFVPFVIREPGEKRVGDAFTPGLAGLRADDADYGWYVARTEAAKAGIPFYGTHDDGGDYDARAFVSLDGEMLEVPADRHGDVTVSVGESLLQPDVPDDLRAYFSKLKAVKKLFGEKEGR